MYTPYSAPIFTLKILWVQRAKEKDRDSEKGREIEIKRGKRQTDTVMRKYIKPIQQIFSLGLEGEREAKIKRGIEDEKGQI